MFLLQLALFGGFGSQLLPISRRKLD